MKTTFKVIGWAAWLILLGICLFNPERLIWKIGFTAGWVFITWLTYELKNAKDMPGDYEPPKRK